MPYVSDAQRKAVWASKNERGEAKMICSKNDDVASPKKSA